MREAVTRARWLALTLLLIGVGALSHTTPSGLYGIDAGPSLDGPGGALVSAVPAPPGALVFGSPNDPTPQDRHAAALLASSPVAGRAPAVAGPTSPDHLARRDDDFLLGMAAAPANAPPSL